MATTYPVRVSYVGNRLPRDLMFDLFRRAADRGGKPGILAKAGQTDDRIERKGYIRLRFTDRRQASAYVRRLERWLSDMDVKSVNVRRCINRGRRKRR